jgi:hypothetical protein
MRATGFVLTGLRKYRNRGHSPIIIDFGVINDWFGIGEKALAFTNYESFEVRPVTHAVLMKLAENKMSERPRTYSLDDFAVWVRSKKHSVIICTKSDFVLAKAIEAITGRSGNISRAIHSRFTNNLKRLFLSKGPSL